MYELIKCIGFSFNQNIKDNTLMIILFTTFSPTLHEDLPEIKCVGSGNVSFLVVEMKSLDVSMSINITEIQLHKRLYPY